MTLQELKQKINREIVENYTGDITAESVNTILNETLDHVGGNETKLGDLALEMEQIKGIGDFVGLIPRDTDFEIGGMTINGSGWQYTDPSKKRIRTKEGVTYHLYKGDKVTLTDSSNNVRVYIGWRNANNQYKFVGWIRCDNKTISYEITEDGEYVFLLSNITEVTQSDIYGLYNKFSIETHVNNETIRKDVINLNTKVVGVDMSLNGGIKELKDFTEGFGGINEDGSLYSTLYKNYYYIENDGVKYIDVTSNSKSTSQLVIALYNSTTIGSASFIKGVNFSSTETEYHLDIPSECKLIVVSLAAGNNILITGENATARYKSVFDELGKLEERTISLDLASYSEIPYNLENGTNWNQSATGYNGILIPRKDLSDTIHLEAISYKLICAFLRDSDITASSAPHYCVGESKINLAIGSSLDKTLPYDCGYLYVYMSLDKYAVGKIDIQVTTKSIVTRVESLEIGEGNQDAYNFVNRTNYNTKRVCLAHFSDIHGNYNTLVKVMAYCTKYSSYISDILFTGDYVNLYSDSMSWWGSVAGASNILGCMGNHEIQDSGSYVKTSHIGKDAYDKFFAPYISNWGVTQPSNASTDGKCYYYKDYGVVRLVVLDWMDYNADQKSWFTSVLTDAKANGKQVIVASHFPSKVIKKHYNSFDSLGEASVKDDGWLAVAPEYKAHEEIQSFINAGGVFICWLCGHMHRDNFGELVGYPNQIVVDVTTCRSDFGSTDLYTTDDTALNLVSIDSANGIFYLNRLGTNLDYYGRERVGLAYDYINHKLIRGK